MLSGHHAYSIAPSLHAWQLQKVTVKMHCHLELPTLLHISNFVFICFCHSILTCLLMTFSRCPYINFANLASFEQMWQGQTAIIGTLHFCCRFHINCCNSKWQQLKGSESKIWDILIPVKFPTGIGEMSRVLQLRSTSRFSLSKLESRSKNKKDRRAAKYAAFNYHWAA